jgi:hypothetical protein
MSYDLYFLLPEHCADPDALAAHMETEGSPSTPAQDARKQALARALRSAEPGLTSAPFDHAKIAEIQGTTLEVAQARFDHVELNAPEGGSGIQISLFADQAAITVPYWHDATRAPEVFAELERYAALLVKHGGYRIYDPQAELVVDDPAELREGFLVSYGRVARSLPQLLAEMEPPAKPWWKLW